MSSRTTQSFPGPCTNELKMKAFQWAASYDHVHFFHHNDIEYPFGAFANRLAAGKLTECPLEAGNTFESIQAFYSQHKDWLIGYFGYDLKNEIEALSSDNEDGLGFPEAYFYQPIHVVDFEKDTLVIHSVERPESVYEAIMQIELPAYTDRQPRLSLSPKITKEAYFQTIERIREHIFLGDVYELNYCMEFFATDAFIHPPSTYWQLNQRSPMPFSVYGRVGEHFIMGASPERFLKKTGTQLLSQPIKGTIRRGENELEDVQLKEQLRHDEKEMAENMMIVDLVRNDLARSALVGSVKVEEMFGIYAFRQVHQMISTVSAQLKQPVDIGQTIRNAFPMGSMTGAPKIKAMELIEAYEVSKRGLFSGAVGYITPQGNFDFNVVIRSILYNSAKRYLSFQVGSAITYDSVPEREYEECLLKAKAMREVLGNE